MNTQYPFFQNWRFDNIWSYCSGSDNFEKITSTFLFVWFYNCLGRRKYKLYSFAYRFQPLNPYLRVSGLLIVMEGPIRNTCLGIVKHDWKLIVCQTANRKPFLSARGNIWNSKLVFYNKTTGGCFNRDLWVVTPVTSIISPWLYLWLLR